MILDYKMSLKTLNDIINKDIRTRYHFYTLLAQIVSMFNSMVVIRIIEQGRVLVPMIAGILVQSLIVAILLYMAFVGIFIASIANFWMENDALDYLISIIGVIVFTGLTAYTMQQLKKIAFDASINADMKNKLALIGGFRLYIMFVNLFLSLLRLFGSRD